MSLISKFNGKMNVSGDLIRNKRQEKNLSYEELSAKLELMGISIHKQSLYDIENDKRTIKDYELIGIVMILDIDLKEMYEELKTKMKI